MGNFVEKSNQLERSHEIPKYDGAHENQKIDFGIPHEDLFPTNCIFRNNLNPRFSKLKELSEDFSILRTFEVNLTKASYSK